MSPGWRLTAERLEAVACPLCGATTTERLAGGDRYGMGLVTVGCRACGLVFTNPQPTAAAVDEFYREHYRSFYQSVEQPDLDYIRRFDKDRRAAQLAATLKDKGALRPGARVLDVGAAEGSVLKALRDAQPAIEPVAIEPGAAFAAFAARHVPCRTFADLAGLRATDPAPFQLVVVNHVLEHAKAPLHLLAECRDLLATDGQLYVDVPDLARYRDLGALHFAHLCHYDAALLRFALERAGFDVVSVEPHQPIRHPASVRAVARRGTGAHTVAPPAVNPAAWQAVRRAWRRRWLWLVAESRPGRLTRALVGSTVARLTRA